MFIERLKKIYLYFTVLMPIFIFLPFGAVFDFNTGAMASEGGSDNDNRTVYVGGKDQGPTIKAEIYTAVTDRVVYRAKRSVDGSMSGKWGKIFILLSIKNNLELEQYTFARPSDTYLTKKGPGRPFIELYAINGKTLDNVTHLFYEEQFLGRNEDYEFVLEGLTALNGSKLILETHYAEETDLKIIQRVELDISYIPLCSDNICKPMEREGDYYCFADCCGDGYCASVESQGANYCFADCCGDGYCASSEREGRHYCPADCCGDGYCAPEEETSCSRDCFVEISCSGCPDYEIRMPADYDYGCTGECPGYFTELDQNNVPYKKKLYGLDEIVSINTIPMPVYPVNPAYDPREKVCTYIPNGGRLASFYWISPPEEVRLFKFILPGEIRLREIGSDKWFTYELNRWSFYMGTVVTVGTGTQDFIVKHAGSHCDEDPPTYEDYLSIREEVWSSKDLCASIMGGCLGRLNREKVWYELGYHIPNPDPPLGCTGEPRSGCELGDHGQSVLVRELDDAQAGCYYALVVNWGEFKWDQTEDIGMRVQVSGSWLRKD